MPLEKTLPSFLKYLKYNKDKDSLGVGRVGNVRLRYSSPIKYNNKPYPINYRF